MSASAVTYDNFAKHIIAGDLIWSSDTIKMALLTTSYTFDQTHEYFSSVSAYELASGGYVRKTLGSKTATMVTNVYTLSAATPITWTSLTASNLRYGIIFKDTGTGSTSPLIQFINFGVTFNLTAEDFTYQIAGTGILSLTMS